MIQSPSTQSRQQYFIVVDLECGLLEHIHRFLRLSYLNLSFLLFLHLFTQFDFGLFKLFFKQRNWRLFIIPFSSFLFLFFTLSNSITHILFIHSFIHYSSIHSFIRPFIRSFIHSSNLFTHRSIHSCPHNEHS